MFRTNKTINGNASSTMYHKDTLRGTSSWTWTVSSFTCSLCGAQTTTHGLATTVTPPQCSCQQNKQMIMHKCTCVYIQIPNKPTLGTPSHQTQIPTHIQARDVTALHFIPWLVHVHVCDYWSLPHFHTHTHTHTNWGVGLACAPHTPT